MLKNLNMEESSSIEGYTENENDVKSFSFKKLELEDIPKILPFLDSFSSHLSDFTIGGLFMWRDYFNIEYLIKDESLFFKLDLLERKNMFTFPIGIDFRKNIEFLKKYSTLNNLPLIFSIISDKELSILKENYEIVDIKNERAWEDYFYLSEDLIELKGRKFNTQRNHINKFIRTYPEYQFVEINKDNINLAIDFLINFYKEYEKTSSISIEEKNITFELFDNYFKYNMLGGMLKVDDKIIGISVGEIINDTLFIHTEKADRNYLGVYQMLNNEFAKHYGENTTYINREEDVGDEGLRRAKLMYNPVELLKKYIVEVKIWN